MGCSTLHASWVGVRFQSLDGFTSTLGMTQVVLQVMYNNLTGNMVQMQPMLAVMGLCACQASSDSSSTADCIDRKAVARGIQPLKDGKLTIARCNLLGMQGAGCCV